MHIQEGTNTTLTTCTKMTEEVDRRHGVNGNGSKGVGEDAPVHNSTHTATGGRLKFFKDGKFILELVRGCAREGERAGWVSVPRKTFWPPAAAPPTPPAPAHAPTSLSVSDDNSSIQSSPWQRDHCWKQPTPRKNVSKELTMYYCRPNTLHTAVIRAGGRAKRRRPYDATHLDSLPNGFKKILSNGLCDKKRNGDLDSSEIKISKNEDVVDGKPLDDTDSKTNVDRDQWTDTDRETYYHMKLKKPYHYHKLRVYKKTGPLVKRKELSKTIDKLRERIAALPAPVNAKLINCRQEHMIVSPRKRILRELERVSLEDRGGKRRAKTVPALSTASYPPSPGPSHTPHRSLADTSARPHNGTAPRRDPPVSKNVISYSIHSLLSMPDESPTRRSPEAAKRSPHSYATAVKTESPLAKSESPFMKTESPSVKTESPSSVHSPDLSPSPDNYRYRYSTLTLGSPGRGAGQEAPTPPPPGAYRAYAAPTYGARFAGSAQYRGSPARDEWREVPYMYGYGYAPPPLYRAPPPLWMHYAMSPGIPPGPWAPLAHPLLTDHIPKEEPTSDLPLNLSKH